MLCSVFNRVFVRVLTVNYVERYEIFWNIGFLALKLDSSVD